MLRSNKIILLLLLLSVPLFSQHKHLSLKQIFFGGYQFVPQKVQQLKWIPGSSDFSFVTKEGVLVRSAAVSGSQSEVVSLPALKSLLPAEDTSDLKFPQVDWQSSTSFRFTAGSKLYVYNISNRTVNPITEFPDSAENVSVSSGGTAAYTIGNNLYIASGSTQTAVTNDADKGIVNGQSVHRNEFGISGGIFWSPDNKKLAFYRMDETMVTDYPLVDITQRPAALNNIKYPMAGMTSHHVTIGVYDIESKKTIFLKTGEPADQYLTTVAWSPDGSAIYTGILNRDQNHLKLTRFSAATGELDKVLFEEKSDKYVEAENPPYFLNDGSFLWLSERDGWNHLYHYKNDGTLIKQVTKGGWEITKFEGFGSDYKNFYITAAKESPLERHLYVVNLTSGELNKLTAEPGTHSASVSADGKYILDAFSSVTVPYTARVLNTSGKTVKNILTTPSPLASLNMGEIKLFTLKSSDGYDLYCRMILPPGFDSTKQYPALVYVYGGPHAQMVTNSWLGGSSLWLNFMAQQGYIVFTLDNRGSAHRGLEFEQETFRDLGTKEIEDQKLGADYLKSLPYVDGSRMGVFGWSYGGFMAASLMTRTPDLFKAGVAGGAVIDWSYYEVMYTERYMDTPETNPEGYKNSSLLNYVDQLKGNLLLVHGTADPTVVWQNSLLFAQKAANLGKRLDYYPYPGHGHGVVGADAYQMYDKITEYFNSALK